MIPFGQPGSGLEFLVFHRDFVKEFHAWYDGQPFADPAAVAPWSAIPAEMKVTEAGWTDVLASQEQQILTGSFGDADALGQYIEGGIHNSWLHGAAATIFHDELVRSPATSPLSTLFYKIHGLVTNWWRKRFPFSAGAKASITKPELDTPHKSLKAEVFEIPTKTSITKPELDTPPIGVNPKPSLKAEIDVPIPIPPPHQVDPGPLAQLLSGLTQRLETLEGEVARGQAFIRQAERPDVGRCGGGEEE